MGRLFDAKSFISQTLQEANATKSVPLPIGDTFGQITKLDIKEGTFNDDEGKERPWYRLEATLETTDREYLSRWSIDDGKAEKAVITYKFMLDVNEGGGIAMGPGKNVKLGRLREAAGVNEPGRSLDQMLGRMIRFSVGNRPDDKDPSIVYSDVNAVAKYAA